MLEVQYEDVVNDLEGRGIGRRRAYEEFLGPLTKTLADKAPSR
jgi:hypothetical protein